MSLRNNSGFTFIELLTVVALVGILAGIAIVSMGNPRGMQSLAEAEALKANLRFTQSKAMSDLPGNMWSLNISSGNYQLLRNGITPVPAVNLPGSDSSTYTLPAGVTITAGTGPIRFNFRGQPVDVALAPLAANQAITVAGASAIIVTRETGFIP